MQDSYVFRNLLMIAGIHYAWNTGGLKQMAQPFLSQKVETIQSVNKWLSSLSSDHVDHCMRQILTLCLAEVSDPIKLIRAASTYLSSYSDLQPRPSSVALVT